jgi:Fe-S oxidoreductase
MTSVGIRRMVNLLTWAGILAIPIIGVIVVLALGDDLGFATREVLWDIGGWFRIIVYVSSLAFPLAIGYLLYRRFEPMFRIGRPERRFDRPLERLKVFAVYGLGQGRMPNDLYASTMHLIIFWGWGVLFIGTLMLSVHDEFKEFLFDRMYLGYKLVLNIFGILAFIGLSMALYRRHVWKHPKMRLGSLWDDLALLWFMLAIVVTGFLVQGLRMVASGELVEHPDWGPWSLVSFGIAKLADWAGGEADILRPLHRSFWGLHVVMAFGWLVWVGVGKLSHILMGSANIALRQLSPTGAELAGSTLSLITDFETRERFGAATLDDFTWKQLADTEVCVRCGRCEANCPAYLTGKELTPMGFLKQVNAYLHEVGPAKAVAIKNGEKDKPEGERIIGGDVVSFNTIWDCLTCGACESQCPIFIEHISQLQGMRRYLVMDEARMPETAQATLMNLEQRGHPWRGAQLTRTTWIEELAAEGMTVAMFDGSQEYLYWVGCTGALQERNVKVTKALVRLLLEAEVSFGVLGAEEGCSGDPARRLGNEYLFQMQAEANIEIFKAKGVQNIIANCPHCFNVMRNEYPQLDGYFQVVHHTELLARLVAQGKLRPQVGDDLSQKAMTYHDSCYIARHNDVLKEPRQVLTATGVTLREMSRHKKTTFCCGAGGGHMWVEESEGRRVNHVRTGEAADTGADIIAVACPFCMQMFEDGVGSVPQAAGRGMQVFDVAELLEISTAFSRPAASLAHDLPPEAAQD